MSWGLGWKRPTEVFHLTLSYGPDADTLDEASPTSSRSSSSASPVSGSSPTAQAAASDTSIITQEPLGFRIDLDWNAGDDEDQTALKLQSQLMVALPTPQDTVEIELTERVDDPEGILGNSEAAEKKEGAAGEVGVEMRIVRKREPLKGVLVKLMKSNFANGVADGGAVDPGCEDHWRNVTVVSLCGLGLTALPVEITRLPLLEKLYLDSNKLSVLPPELGELKNLKVLAADYNMLVSVPVELRQCAGLVELSLEHNKLVRPILDFRAMSELHVLRLFGNPLEFLPDILALHQLRHLSLANIRIVADENLVSVNVQIEMENSSYFVASRHKLSAFFSLIFRFSSCHHPLLASALAKIMQDEANRVVVGKDENAVRQLISMISSENQHVVEQACSALSALASDVLVAMQLMKSDIMQPIERVLKSSGSKEIISVLQVMVELAFTSDIVSQKMLTKDILRSLKLLCAHKDPEVQKLALFAVGNLAFCLENRRALVTSESLRELLLRLTAASVSGVCKAAARALAILGENEILRRAIKGRPVPKRGLRILTMDGGGMKGLATVKILREIEKGTGKQIHELFDLICGTSTGGMLAVALGIKLMSLEKCEEIYKELGKLVFAEPVTKENEAATWREKLDQLYKSSSQSFRVVVHGSKHSADQFERLLKEMCTDDDGDLLIESAVKKTPKVFVVSTLVSVAPAQPFIFRNYQYPAGTPEISSAVSENLTTGGQGVATTGAQVGYKRNAFIGSCKHQIWQAIRASSAAPYYLDDFSDGIYRWQDGAIVANNPTIFAIREAQLLWPDSKIDCLVSVGCGSVPTKVRKGGWRYLDTGQVLIESACSVDRVEEALSTLLPMLPDVHYFRFNPVDERCDMELDETDPTIWLKLEGATDEYINNNSVAFKNLAEILLESSHDEKSLESLKSQQVLRGRVSNENSASLGWRRGVLLVEASNSPDSGRVFHHARTLETFCASNGIKLSLANGASVTIKGKRLRVDLNRQIHDRAVACEILNVPEAEWRKTGDHVNRPYGEGSSSSNNNQGSNFRVHVKGLIERTIGGVGVAICDVNGGLVFQLSKGFNGKEQQLNDKEFVELKALLEGLDVAVLLGLKSVHVVTDTPLLYQYITGKNPRVTRNVASLCDQINLLMRNFTATRVSLVASSQINSAMELARNAIALQVKRSAGSSSNAKNLTESCAICFEDAFVDQMFLIAGCLHRYCFSCMSKHVQFKLLQGSLPKCPHENCKSELKLDSCKKFLTPELFGILSQRVKEASIPAEDKIYCPYLKCSTLLSRTELRGSTGPQKCPKCSDVFCISCEVPWHSNMSCFEFKRLNTLQCNEDKKLKVLANQNRWRECPKCKHMVSLGEGCYHIYCRCGHQFCYTCGAEWKNKKATCTCPIWDERNIIYSQQHRR